MKKVLSILGATIIGITLIACGVDSGPSKPIGTPNAAASANTNVEPAKESYATPTPKDFTLTIKTTEKECFGSAGCNITFHVTLKQVTSANFDPSKTYELTYDVQGGEDPYTHTLEITGDKYSTDDKEYISTKSSKSVLKAVITSVEEQ